MSILWVGTSIADLQITGGATSASGQASPNVSESFRSFSLTAAAFSHAIEQRNNIWISDYVQTLGAGIETDNSLIAMFDANAVAIARIRLNSYDTGPILELRTGLSSWVTVATGLFGTTLNLKRFDINYKSHVTEGIFRLFIDGVICAEFTGNTIPSYGNPTIQRIGFGSSNFNGHAHSAIIVADEDTRTMVFYQRTPTGDGTETDWTGDYTSIDEIGFNDGDFIAASSQGDTETFIFADLPSDANSQQLAALIISGRIKSSGALQEILGAAKISGTVFDIDAKYPSSPIFVAQHWQSVINPATGLPWLGSEVNAAEFGVKVA